MSQQFVFHSLLRNDAFPDSAAYDVSDQTPGFLVSKTKKKRKDCFLTGLDFALRI